MGRYDMSKEVSYNGIDYILLEILPSEYLLVIPKGSEYPANPVIIPGK